MRGRFGAKITFFVFKSPYLRHELFAERGMVRESLIVLTDLLAQVFLFDLQQRFGITLFEAGNEKSQKPSEQVHDSLKHSTLLPTNVLAHPLASLPAGQKVIDDLGLWRFTDRPHVHSNAGGRVGFKETTGKFNRNVGISGPEPVGQRLLLNWLAHEKVQKLGGCFTLFRTAPWSVND